MKFAVLISGNGSNLQALIDAQAQSQYQISLVISNKPDAYGLERAKLAQIPTQILDHNLFDSREKFDTALLKIIQEAEIDAVILAGFMRILTPGFTDHFVGRMLNIHPSLLPKYPGLHTHQKALDAGDSEHGLSIHFVTSELDGGPIILQSIVKITPQDTLDSLKHKVHIEEHKTYPLVANWLAQGRLKLQDHAVWFDDFPLSQPLTFKEVAQ